MPAGATPERDEESIAARASGGSAVVSRRACRASSHGAGARRVDRLQFHRFQSTSNEKGEAMGISALLRWQWEGYSRYHASRANLLLHLIVVPVFIAGSIGLIAALLRGSLVFAALALAAMITSIALQGRGHRVEAQPPEPFTGPANAVLRIVFEQWITFPRFVLSGGWLRAGRATEARH
jgi:hypothetical protein